MYGLEAISANNGWTMAAMGITIVFTGLLVLSLLVSQLYRALSLWDKRVLFYEWIKNLGRKKEEMSVSDLDLPLHIQSAVAQFDLIVERLGEPFPLPKLLELVEKFGLEKPHSTINSFIVSGLLSPDGKGYYLWKKNIKS